MIFTTKTYYQLGHDMFLIIAILQSESRVAVNWLSKNKMVNPKKFQSIVLDKTKSDNH